MARPTHVKKAQKAVPEAGIAVGDSYYWWKFRHGGKRYSKTPPKRSQLTQSNFYSTIYDLEDDVIAGAPADETLPDVRDEVVSALNDAKDECESSLDNIPDNLKDGSSGQLLQERIDALESAISEFEDLDLEEFDFEPEQGSEVTDEQEDADGKCDKCGEMMRHTVDCEYSDADEAVDADGETKTEAEETYWQSKLEEFQGISIEAP